MFQVEQEQSGKQNHVLTAACMGVDNGDKQSEPLSFFRLEMTITPQLNVHKSHRYIYVSKFGISLIKYCQTQHKQYK